MFVRCFFIGIQEGIRCVDCIPCIYFIVNICGVIKMETYAGALSALLDEEEGVEFEVEGLLY